MLGRPDRNLVAQSDLDYPGGSSPVVGRGTRRGRGPLQLVESGVGGISYPEGRLGSRPTHRTSGGGAGGGVRRPLCIDPPTPRSPDPNLSDCRPESREPPSPRSRVSLQVLHPQSLRRRAGLLGLPVSGPASTGKEKPVGRRPTGHDVVRSPTPRPTGSRGRPPVVVLAFRDLVGPDLHTRRHPRPPVHIVSSPACRPR